MTKDQVARILDRVRSWPPERQEDIARIAELMEAQDASGVRLTAEQVAEVRRRLAEPDAATIPARDAFKQIRSRAR